MFGKLSQCRLRLSLWSLVVASSSGSVTVLKEYKYYGRFGRNWSLCIRTYCIGIKSVYKEIIIQKTSDFLWKKTRCSGSYCIGLCSSIIPSWIRPFLEALPIAYCHHWSYARCGYKVPGMILLGGLKRAMLLDCSKDTSVHISTCTG